MLLTTRATSVPWTRLQLDKLAFRQAEESSQEPRIGKESNGAGADTRPLVDDQGQAFQCRQLALGSCQYRSRDSHSLLRRNSSAEITVAAKVELKILYMGQNISPDGKHGQVAGISDRLRRVELERSRQCSIDEIPPALKPDVHASPESVSDFNEELL